ncbi:MAG: hypothetical protein ACI94Y_003007 [Maribacter sp.]|jgi:hypothetical protein
MKILLITETIPFSPRNGRELPTAEIFAKLSQNAHVDILVVSKDHTDFEKRKKNIPAHFGFCKQIGFTNKGSKGKRIIQEILGNKPSYFSKIFNIKEIQNAIGEKTYDYLWISPAALYTFVQCLIDNDYRIFDKVAIGMNDLKSGMYYDSIHEAIGFRTLHSPYFTRFFRSFFMKKAECKFLSQVDFIHVQTQSEAKKTKKILKTRAAGNPLICVAPNGYKKNLIACKYKGKDSVNILYMTQLNEGRKIESKWFINNIWPLIHREIPEAKILIPGKIQNKEDVFIQKLKKTPGVELLGFVENLEELFDNVRMAVVPIFHGTGLINRILDNLTAGVPMVSTPNAISTFESLESGEHILSASSARLFADQVIALYSDRTLRLELSNKGRDYVLSNHPDWNTSGGRIADKMALVLEKTHSRFLKE